MVAHHDLHPVDRRSLWRENHGNLLLAFAGMILLTGLAILAYRQWRPTQPHFRHIRAEPQSSDAVPVSGDHALWGPGDESPPPEAAAEDDAAQAPGGEPADTEPADTTNANDQVPMPNG